MDKYENEIDQILSVSEAAKLLKTGKTRIYKLLESGELKGIRLCEHGTWRIPKACIKEMIKNKIRN